MIGSCLKAKGKAVILSAKAKVITEYSALEISSTNVERAHKMASVVMIINYCVRTWD